MFGAPTVRSASGRSPSIEMIATLPEAAEGTFTGSEGGAEGATGFPPHPASDTMVASNIASTVMLAVSDRRARAGLLPAWTSNQASCRTGVASRRAENDQPVSVTQRTIYQLELPEQVL